MTMTLLIIPTALEEIKAQTQLLPKITIWSNNSLSPSNKWLENTFQKSDVVNFHKKSSNKPGNTSKRSEHPANKFLKPCSTKMSTKNSSKK